MKLILRVLIVAVVSCFGSAGRGQTLYQNEQTGFALFAPAPDLLVGQTFTGFTAIESMTWTLENTGVGASSGGNFQAYVVAWNPLTTSNFAFGLTPLYQSGPTAFGFNLGAGISDDLEFTTSLTGLDASATYALILSATSNDGLAPLIAFNASADPFFASGVYAQLSTAGDVSSFLLGNSVVFDAFADSGVAMSVMGTIGTLTPVPEPKTAAAAMAVLFVGAMIVRQRWLRRRAAAAPLAA